MSKPPSEVLKASFAYTCNWSGWVPKFWMATWSEICAPGVAE